MGQEPIPWKEKGAISTLHSLNPFPVVFCVVLMLFFSMFYQKDTVQNEKVIPDSVGLGFLTKPQDDLAWKGPL